MSSGLILAVNPSGIARNLACDTQDQLKVAGSLTSTPPAAGTSTLSSVGETAAATTLLPANASRLAFSIWNDTGGTLYVKLGAGAAVSAGNWQYKVMPGGWLRTADLGVNYTGLLSGIWTGTGSGLGSAAAQIAELSA